MQLDKDKLDVLMQLMQFLKSGIRFLQVGPSAISEIDDRQCVICEYYHSLEIFNHIVPMSNFRTVYKVDTSVVLQRKSWLHYSIFLLSLRQRERQRQRQPLSTLFMVMLDDIAVIDRYRLPRGEIVQLLNVIGPHLMCATRMNFAVSPDVYFLAAPRYHATGSFLQVLGDGLGLSKTSVSRAVQVVNYALLPLAAEHIPFPASRQAMSGIQEYFLTHYHIPQVIGVVDGILIPISTPSVDGHIYA